MLRVNAPVKASASVIILHGLGDSANGWRFLSDMLHREQQFQSVNFIFPNAPVRPLSVAGGQRISQWFDIYEMGNPNARQDEDGYWGSVKQICHLIDNEVNNGIDPSKIIVGGFSQGASVSLGIASCYEKKLAGVLCLSGFFSMKKGLSSRLVDTNKETSIYHGHGDLDPVIGIDYARLTHQYFKQLGFSHYELHEFSGMAHSTCNEELADIRNFISTHLSL